MTIALAMAFSCLLLPWPTAAQDSVSIGVGVRVSDSFRSSDDRDVQIDAYVQEKDEGVVDSADISLDYGKGVPFGVVVILEGEQGSDSVLLKDVFMNDGFEEQLHIEFLGGRTLSVEVCDSLADVPSGFEEEEKTMEEILNTALPSTEGEKAVTVDISF